MFNIYKIIPENIKNLVAYQSARKIGGKGKIWLNANESPYANHQKFTFENLNRYPQCQPETLLFAYSEYSKIPKKNILITRGADEGIELLMRAFCKSGKDAIMTIVPTYGMYDITSKIMGIKNKKIFSFWKKKISINQIINNIKNVKIIYLCRPNNPTGDLIDINTIYDILNLSKNKFLVVIDEAYIDFCLCKSLAYLIKTFNNLVILRTLSKAFGLAGIRCGFIITSSEIINIILKIIAPYPIPFPVSEIACSSLSVQSIKKISVRINQINLNRTWMIKELKKFGFIQKVFSSYANFILIKTKETKKVWLNLKKNGIVIRNQNHVHTLEDCLRISVGTHSECKKVINSLKKIN